ncbi:MAG: glycosyltransferase [Thermaurantimonas sp.]
MADTYPIPTVFWITPWYPSRIHATLGNFVERHTRVASRRAEIYLLHFFSSSHSNNQIEPIKEAGFQGHHYFYKNSMTGKVRLFIHLIQQLRTRSARTAIVHLTIFHETYWIAVLCRLIIRKPVVCTEHWTGYHNGKFQELPLWRRMMIRWSSGFVDEFLPVTKHLGQCMVQCFHRRISYSVLPNVVDTQVFTPGAEGGKKFDFVHISTLDTQHKRPEAILRQFAKVKDQYHSATMSMGGDGDNRGLIKLAEELGLGNSVTFFGELKSREVAEKLRQSRCLVLYSRYENFPCVIPEAWACGTPVIASDVGGIREWLTDELGLLVSPDREDDLGEAMLLFMKNKHIYKRDVLAEYASKHFGEESVTQLVNTIYNRHLMHV